MRKISKEKLGIAVMVLFLLFVFAINHSYKKNNPPEEQRFSKEDGSILKEKATSETASNISESEDSFFSVPDVYKEHYHHSEFHNGNLYVIRRVGSLEYPSMDWRDELWKYRPDNNGERIYSSQGIDFRVSEDEQFIAVFSVSPNSETQDLVLFGGDGSIIKIFSAEELEDSQEYFHSPLGWSKDNIFWMERSYTVDVAQISKLDPKTFQITNYDLWELPVIHGEFSLNMEKGILAFSDYPAIFDVISRDDFKTSGSVVTLFTYNLESNDKKVIATSIAKAFRPDWLDQDTLEYDNPESEGRITKKND